MEGWDGIRFRHLESVTLSAEHDIALNQARAGHKTTRAGFLGVLRGDNKIRKKQFLYNNRFGYPRSLLASEPALVGLVAEFKYNDANRISCLPSPL
jgi:hypothetical protein